jgi:hypothetical protein
MLASLNLLSLIVYTCLKLPVLKIEILYTMIWFFVSNKFSTDKTKCNFTAVPIKGNNRREWGRKLNFNLKHLEAFDWVADLGSFRKAADRLNTIQLNISYEMPLWNRHSMFR